MSIESTANAEKIAAGLTEAQRRAVLVLRCEYVDDRPKLVWAYRLTPHLGLAVREILRRQS